MVTPSQLDALLRVLQDRKVRSARITETEISVEFDVMPLEVGDVPQPGGWKSPQRLDDPAQLELDREVP